MYLDITSEGGCCCALCFPTNNSNAYLTQNPGICSAVGNDDFAVEVWIKPSVVTGAFEPVWGWYRQFTQLADEGFWLLDIVNIAGVHYIRFTVGYEMGAPGTRLTARSIDPLMVGEWNHIVVNKISSDRNKFEIYTNGHRSNTNILTGPNNTVNNPAGAYTNHGFSYGRFTNQYESGYYSGCIAQARFYNRPLGYAEVKHNRRYGFFKPFNLDNVMSWVPFNNCEGSTTAAIDCNVQTVYLTNGIITWVGDCFQSGVDECDNSSSCDRGREEDIILVDLCDQVSFPALSDFSICTPTGNVSPSLNVSGIIGYCTGCVDNEQVGTETFNVIHEVTKKGYLSFSISDYSAASYLKIGIYDCATDSFTNVGTFQLDADEQVTINTILDIDPLNIYYQDGVFYYGVDCSCDSDYIMLTRRLHEITETSPFDGIYLGQYPEIYNCEPTNCSNYIIFNYVDVCFTKVSDPTCISTDRYNFDVSCTPLPLGNGCLLGGLGRICFAEPTSGQSNFFSQSVNIGSHCDSTLIRYRNENEGWITQRINAMVKQVNYNKRQEISMSSKGITRKLLSVIDDIYQIETDYYTKRWHDKFLRAIEADYIEFEFEGEWIGMVAEDTYQIEWEDVPMPKKGKGSITLKKSKYKYLNTFC